MIEKKKSGGGNGRNSGCGGCSDAATLVVLHIFTLQDVRGSFVNSCEMGGDKGNKLAKDRWNRRSYLHRTLYIIRWCKYIVHISLLRNRTHT